MKINKFLVLTKLLLKSNFGSGKKTNNNGYLIGKIIAVIVISIFASVINITLLASLSFFKLQSLLIIINYSLVTFIIFFFGIFYVMNVFYFSRDIDYLLPLPLKPNTIVLSKFAVTIIYEYFIEIIILLPFTVIYGIANSSGLIFYLYSLIIILLLPIIPIALALLISIIMMPFINMSKSKDLFKIIGGIFGIFIGLSINLFSQNLTINNTNSDVLMENFKNISNKSNSIIPGLKYIYNSLTNWNNSAGFLNILLFILISLIAIIIISLLSNFFYLKGVVGLSESSSKRKKLSKSALSKKVYKNALLKSYIIKELKLILRTPAYFLNCIIPNLLWPIILILPLVMNTSASDKNELMLVGNLITSNVNSGLIIGMSLAAGMFIGAANGISSTAISREGDSYFSMKYIPVPYSKQVLAKMLSGVIVSTLGFLLFLITFFIIFKLPFYLLFFSILTAMMGIIFSNIVGIILDLFMPKLQWDTEQKAVKQNFNILFLIIISIISSALTIFACINLNTKLLLTFIIINFLLLIINYLLYKLMCNCAEIKLSKL